MESGRVTTIRGYPTRRIVDQISGLVGDDGNRQ